MDLKLTEEQAALRDAFATFFERESPIPAVRASAELGFDPKLWERLRRTGVLETGDAGLLESAIVATEVGRRLAPVPFAEHVAAVRLLERVGGPLLMPDGAEPATLVPRPVGRVLTTVPAGAVARHIVVLDEKQRLLLLRHDPPMRAGRNFADLPLNDGPIPLDDLEIHELATGSAAVREHERAVTEWRVLLAAALYGLTEQALDLATSYVTTRRQFGVPIGSFQAVQHGLAELTGPVKGLRLLAYKAAWAADHAPRDAAKLAVMASIFGAELAELTTTRALHYHGGYGAMAEYDIQLYYRRAKGWPLQLGDPARDLGRLATLLFGHPKGPADALRE
jgi:alkylation response protein AidB-like acyl-CoA dehydrogenase